MFRQYCIYLCLSFMPLFAAGCCTIGGGACGGGMGGLATIGNCAGSCDTGGCSSGTCDGALAGPGLVAGLAGLNNCRGACGDIYVDEWISEPPVPDDCGYPCGGCGRCGSCTPLRSILRQLWGRPYNTTCSTGLCGPSCDGGCDGGMMEGNFAGDVVHGHYEHSGGQAHGAGCNCGSHSVASPVNRSVPGSVAPMQSAPMQPTPMQIAPPAGPTSAVPTPAPQMAPSSARRLNPAVQRRVATQASARSNL